MVGDTPLQGEITLFHAYISEEKKIVGEGSSFSRSCDHRIKNSFAETSPRTKPNYFFSPDKSKTPPICCSLELASILISFDSHDDS
jgi:hypothetical protein